MTEGIVTSTGKGMMSLAGRLYPICRSITGQGLRMSLGIIAEQIPLEMFEVPTGTPVFDWTVPEEWNLELATLTDPHGKVIADTRLHNLHVLNYSEPRHEMLDLEELRSHLFSLPDRPDWIPYRTSYYTRNWGFCLPHRVIKSLQPGKYEVRINTTLSHGSLTYGECCLKGQTDDEVLFSAHACHPSLANDNLSGIVVAVALAQWLMNQKHRYTYRFVFAPGTIGALCWLANNRTTVRRISHGLVLSCLGDSGSITYKRSRQGSAMIDRIVEHVLKEQASDYQVRDFVPYGYDERQYCSPGFNLPVGVLMRTPYGEYPEYHTSADNLDLLNPQSLEHSLSVLQKIVQVIETNRRYVNLSPYGEPQLGKRHLYSSTGGAPKSPGYEMALLWMLNYSDGQHDLLDISMKSGLPFVTLVSAADRLKEASLLRSE